MPHWIYIIALVLVALFTIMLFALMFTQMGVKRKTGTMKGKRASQRTADRKSNKSRPGKGGSKRSVNPSGKSRR